MLTVLVPAHNEEDQIAETLQSLLRQTHKPDKIVVVSDNSTDNTVSIARMFSVLDDSVTVFETQYNTAMKAGALNQALNQIMLDSSDTDEILIMDADSSLVDSWIENALPWLAKHGCVSGAYEAKQFNNLVEKMQHLEYTQQRRRISRSGGRVAVLSGAASIYYAKVLGDVARFRGTLLPGHFGQYYREDSLTEDFEVTLAAKELGYDPVSPSTLIVKTDVMHTLKELWGQRLRWQRGYLETLISYPLQSTWRQWVLQSATYGMSLLPILIVLMLVGAALQGPLEFNFFFAILIPLFVIVEIVEAWDGGRESRLLALSILPNSVYGMYRNLIYWYAIWVSVRRKESIWS